MNYEERAREFMRRAQASDRFPLSLLAALLAEVAGEARQGFLAEMDLLSQDPETQGKNWADAVHRYAVSARTPRTPYDRGREVGRREGWRRACERCATKVASIGNPCDDDEARTAYDDATDDAAYKCRTLAGNYEDPE